MSESMGGGDPNSIALQAGRGVTPIVNPLATYSQYIQLQNQLNQQKLFPGQFQQQQLKTQSDQLGLTQQRNQAAYAALAPILNKPGFTVGDVTSTLAGAQASGIPVDGVIARMAADGHPTDPDGLHSYVKGLVSQSLPAGQQIDMLSPGSVIEDNGQRIQGFSVGSRLSANPGALNPSGGYIQKQTSPETNAAPVQFVGPRGEQETAPRSALPGANGIVNPDSTPQGESAPPPSPSNPPRLYGNAAPSSQNGLPPGSWQTSLPPGQAGAAETASRGASEGALQLAQSANSVPQQKALLGNLQSQLYDISTGGASGWINASKKFANSINPFGNIFDPSKISRQEEFEKQAYNLAQSQFQALGGTGTDAKLESTMHTSPSVALSPMGNNNIINLLKGNADAIAVMNNQWQTHWLPTHNGDTSTFTKFQQQFNENFDPRVYQWVYMTQPERQVSLNGMSNPEQSAFAAKYRYAVNNRFIPDPRVDNTNQAPAAPAAQPQQSGPTIPTND